MKEFEKRWNFRYEDVSKHQSFEKEIGRYFWKGALEWALKTMESCSGNLQEFIHNVNNGLNKIREELEQ
ncbi:MAG: hypothetical protein ACTSRW_17315 [Candidatus Helarchaeota archaeon]